MTEQEEMALGRIRLAPASTAIVWTVNGCSNSGFENSGLVRTAG
jgi:hypothetical protein